MEATVKPVNWRGPAWWERIMMPSVVAGSHQQRGAPKAWRDQQRSLFISPHFNFSDMKENWFIPIVISLAILSGWLTPNTTNPLVVKSSQQAQIKQFQIPTVFHPDAPIPLVPHRVDRLRPISPTFLGIYPFSKTLPIHKERQFLGNAHEFYQQDSLSHYTGSGLQLVPVPQIHLANLSTFRYSSENATFFPVFLTNETSTPLALQGQNSYLFAIQEAKDSTGIWRPIETRVMRSCTTGPWARKIMPQHFAVFLMPKYAGEFETELRVRFRNGTQILVSQSYKGSINYQQFSLPGEDLYYAKFYRKQRYYFVKDCFGSIPLDLSTELHP